MVKRVRALSGITRKELAELAEVSPSTIGRIERGTLDPTWGTLSRILGSAGYQINGDTIVSAGDSTAVAAARRVLASVFSSDEGAAAARVAVARPQVAVDSTAEATRQWLARWARAGWISEKPKADDMVTLAVSAGNAAKISRRNVATRNVVAEGGWQVLATRLGDAGIDYGVSGLVATRPDRAAAAAVNPVIYVESPSQIVEVFELQETRPGAGVLLIAPESDELQTVEIEDGIRFVSRPQGVLDAFAGWGREPDKAEAALRQLLAVSA